MLSLPLKATYALATFISTLQYHLAKNDSNIVKDNLKAVFPEKSDKEIAKLAKQVFINFGKYLADFLRFSKIDRRFLKERVKVEGLENIDEALKKGKGIIIISAHIGNWELGGAVMGMLGYDIMAVVLPHPYKKVDDFFNHQRLMKNLQVCSLGRAAYCCLTSLKENKLIALVADRNFTNHGVVIDFLNKKSNLPKGPAAFHLKTGAPIIGAFCIRQDDDSFKLILEPALQFNLSGDNEQNSEIITKKLAATIERYIKLYPNQWYMFRRFWVE